MKKIAFCVIATFIPLAGLAQATCSTGSSLIACNKCTSSSGWKATRNYYATGCTNDYNYSQQLGCNTCTAS